MKRVDSDGATAEGLFQDKNIETGTPGTEFEATWHNSVQEEICNVIESEDIELDADDNTQLSQSIEQKIKNETRGSLVITGDYVIPTNNTNKYYVNVGSVGATWVTLPNFSENIGRRIAITKISSSANILYIKTASGTEMINGVVRNSTDIFGNNAGIPTGDPGGIVAQYHGVVIDIISATQAVIIDHIKPYEKTYGGGHNYNGVTLVVTGNPTVTLTGSCFIPYQTIDGQWWLRFSIWANLNSSSQSIDISIQGVQFLINQSITVYSNEIISSNSMVGWTGVLDNKLYISSSIAIDDVFLTGDVVLTSKPSWAD